jgi:hypothetical protein
MKHRTNVANNGFPLPTTYFGKKGEQSLPTLSLMDLTFLNLSTINQTTMYKNLGIVLYRFKAR